MKWITMIVLGLAMVLPASASASSCNSTSSQYSHKTCSVVHVTSPTTTTATSGPTTSTPEATSASTLPFTGLDLVLLAAGGGVLLGAGLLVRHLASDNR